ncbi:MAG: cobalamin biosynthesis protein [Microcystis aeruginosa L211-101]|nr:cobalamin biosynthesis protein [Microcystis aeruginosa L211-11]NCR30127.1 cobalamin biosynthesis protein [Microcystis aeruginosa L211-101]
MKEAATAIILVLGAVLDYLIGDPWGWIHPVQVMGAIIAVATKVILNWTREKIGQRLAGIILGLGLIILTGALTWLGIQWLDQVNLLLSYLVQVILLASCLAGRSLRRAAETVTAALQAENITLARCQLSLYVGRDTDNLGREEILRALLETVSENGVDGVTAPLFYALLGAFLGVGPVPLACAYKAASTLDSMIGYRRPPYTHMGWFSAKSEDVLTWLPCRLTVLTLALISGQPGRVLSICWRDARRDPSPNSGWSECVYGAIFGVQLGGKNQYRGQIVEKPLLGDNLKPITVKTVEQALNLTRTCVLLWLAIAVSCLIARDFAQL